MKANTPNIGNKEVPFFRLSDTILSDLKTLYEKFSTNEVDQGTIAEVLGHKSAESGTFKTKLASMRDYGLIDGRGKLRITDIGEKIVEPRPKNPNDRNDSLIRAVKKVPLWNALYDKYTAKGQELPDADFWLDLKDMCGLTIEEAKKQASDVRNWFKEDVKAIRATPENTSAMNPQGIEGQTPATPKSPILEGLIEMKYKGNAVYLEKDDPLKSWKATKAMVDAIMKAEYEEAS